MLFFIENREKFLLFIDVNLMEIYYKLFYFAKLIGQGAHRNVHL